MHVQLLVAEAVVGSTAVAADQLRAQDLSVEGVGALPVRHVDDHVVDADREQGQNLLQLD
jgi:hypothetical protein